MSIATDFLKQLRSAGPWLLTAITPDKPIIKTATVNTAEKADDFVSQRDGKQNLYYSVNPTRNAMNKKAEKVDIAAVEYLLADLDPNKDETSEAAKARYLQQLNGTFEPKPTAIIDSGNGIQCLWKLAEPIALPPGSDEVIADVEARTAAIMLRLGAKPGTQNIDRILRLPGTTNLPNKVKREAGRVACPTKLIEFNGASYPLGAFPLPEQNKSGSPEDGGHHARQDDETKLETIIRDGESGQFGGDRSRAVWFVIQEMARLGNPKRAIISVLLDHANKISEHIYDQGGNPRQTAARQVARALEDIQSRLPVIKPIDFANWDNEETPQLDYAVPDRVPANSVTLFSGQGGAGKSLLQLLLSTATVLAQSWLDVIPRRGPALFIDCEDEEKVLHIRQAAVVNHFGVLHADLVGKLHLISWFGEDTVLGWFNRRTSKIEPTPLYKILSEMVGDIKPSIIGLASVTNVFAGNELDRVQVQQFVGMLTRIAKIGNSGFSLISHPSLAGISTNTGLSGSTQWHNAVRARMYLKGADDKGDDLNSNSGLRILEFKKNNYGPITSQVYLRWKNGLFLPVDNMSAEQQARRDKVKSIFMDLLQSFHQQNRKASDRTGHNYAPNLFFQERAAKEANCLKEELAQAMRDLLDEKLIIVTEYGKPSHRTYELKINPEQGEMGWGNP
jgi:RecA-family ATPase